MENMLDKYITKKDIFKKIGISPAQLDRNIKKGLFPKGIRVGGRKLYWKEKDIVNFLNNKANSDNI